MLCEPAVNAVVLNVAVVPDKVPFPRFVVPSKKVTLPVGVPDATETVAVKVTFWPTVDGFADEVTAVLYIILFTH